MTSLAKQLQKLSIPGQPSLKQATSKKRPSLLFEPEKASDIPTDTIHSLGLNGLAELINRDPSFSIFEATLFQESHKGFEREVLTKQELDDVGSKLEDLLRRLSPYFLQRPAQKCLEWLLRVFKVHCYHTDALMECVLPYYQTNLFARVVQLLPLKDHNSKWAWLRPVKKTGSPLSKQTLVQHCLSDLAFLDRICAMVPASLRAHRNSQWSMLGKMVSLFTSTVMAVLEKANPVTEAIVLLLVPYVEKGLKSKCMDYRASVYMIVSQLAVLVNMGGELSKALVERVSKSLCDVLLKEGLCCLAILCEKQRIDFISKKALGRLIGNGLLVPTLSSLSRDHTLTALLSAVLTSLLDMHMASLCCHDTEEGGAALNLILEILDEVQLTDETVYSLIRKLLTSVVQLCEQTFVKEGKRWRQFKERLKAETESLTQSLDTKFPVLMDRALEDCIANISTSNTKHSRAVNGDSENVIHGNHGNGTADSALSAIDADSEVEARVKFLHDFVSSSLPKSRHQVLTSAGSTLVLSVHHPNPSMRAAAISQLGKTLGSKAKDLLCSDADRNFISSSLSSRLADEDSSVVQAVLELGPKVLFPWLPLSELLPSLTALLTRRQLHLAPMEWQACALKSLSILTSKSLLEVAPPQDLDQVVARGIPLLFLGRNGNEFGGRVLEVLKDSALAKTHATLKSLSQLAGGKVWRKGCATGNHRDENVLSEANAAVFSHLGENIGQSASGKEILSKLVGVVCSTPTDKRAYFALAAVTVCALKATPPADVDTQHSQALRLLSHFKENLGSLAIGVEKSRSGCGQAGVFRPLVEKHADKALSLRLLLLWALDGISVSLLMPEGLSTNMWLNVTRSSPQEQLYYDLLLTLFSVLTEVTDFQLEGKGQGVIAPCKIMIQNLLKSHFSKRGSLLRFLAMIWTTPLGTELGPLPLVGLSPTLQACSLSIACAYLKSLDVQAAMALTGNQCPVIPSLLIPLTSPYKLIRERALHCLITLQDTLAPLHPNPSKATPPSNGPPPPPILQLVHDITQHTLEISTDPTQLPYLLGKFYSRGPSLPPPPPTPTRRKSKRRATVADVMEVQSAADVGVGWLDCLLVHVVSLGMPVFIQHQFLRVLGKVDHITKAVSLVPLISGLLEIRDGGGNAMETEDTAPQNHDLSEHEAATLSLAIQTFTPAVAPALSQHSQLFQLLLSLLHVDTQSSTLFPPPVKLVLQQVSPEFFVCVDDLTLQQTLLRVLIDLLSHTKHSEVTVCVKECVAKLPMSAVLVAGELKRDAKILDKDMSQPTPSKRRRVKTVAPSVAIETGASADVSRIWKRVTLVLELFEHSCPLISETHTLVPVLFALLNNCLELEEQLRFELEYCQQLILSFLLNITSHLTSTETCVTDLVAETQFNVELVVQCLRLSSNPQTHHHAYLLLSSAATIFPALVLHNIMPIFTFMGASILRQDSQYSFQIITKTIDTVIPPLIKSTATRSAITKGRTPAKRGSKAAPTTVEGVVAEIIRTFVDALPHIPDHRKLVLFSHLIGTVGASEYLHVALGLLVEKQVVQETTVAVGDGTEQSAPVRVAKVNVDLCVSIAQMFPPVVQALAASKLAQYMIQLPQEKPSSSFKIRQLPPALCTIFNIPSRTDKQLRQFKSLTLSTLVALLSHKEFVVKAALEANEIEENIIKFLQCVLSYTSQLSKLLDEKASQGDGGDSKFWKILLKKSYLVVDKVTALLSFDAFLEVISQLVGVASTEGVVGGEAVQKKALGMLSSKLGNPKTKILNTHDPYLLSLLDVLMGVACESSTPLGCKQVSLGCVKLVVKQLAGSYSKKITKVMQQLVEIMSDSDLSTSVMGSCLQCVEETCLSLGPHLIPLLPSLLPLVLSQLGKKPHGQKSRHVQLQLSATAALHSIVRTLPNFLGSFASDIIIKVCHPGCVGEGDNLTKLGKESAKVRNEMGTLVPVRSLLPAYLTSYKAVVPHGKDSVLALLGMLSATIGGLGKEDSKTHGNLLLEIFLTCLDYRTQETKGNTPLPTVEAVEGKCLEAFTGLVVKLSEVQFRPILLKLLDWASNSTSPRTRLITFYHLTDRVADKLKGLFLLFAGHFIPNAVSLLDQNHSHKQVSLFFSDDNDEEDEDGEGHDLAIRHSCLLLRYILQCLTKCFLYDRTGFLTKERFHSLMQPLVDQVTNTLGGAEEYSVRVGGRLTSCVANFGLAAGKEHMWKPLNRQLINNTKHKSSQVRFGTLKVLQELYTKLGEEMVVLLPETTPYLYELMEDDCEEVEQLTQEVIKTVERICGETIQF